MEAFQPSDDVALIVHSSYGDHFWEGELRAAMSTASGPAVLFFQVPDSSQMHKAPTQAMPACPSDKGVLFSVNETRTAAIEQVTLVVHGLKILVADTQTPLSHAEMLRLYRSANVYVSPFRSEGFGLGTLEAMALGLQACFWSSIEICSPCTYTPSNA